MVSFRGMDLTEGSQFEGADLRGACFAGIATIAPGRELWEWRPVLGLLRGGVSPIMGFDLRAWTYRVCSYFRGGVAGWVLDQICRGVVLQSKQGCLVECSACRAEARHPGSTQNNWI